MFSYEAALARLPRWMLLLSFSGLAAAFWLGGVDSASGFLAGALVAYLNYRIIERAVNRVARLATSSQEPASSRDPASKAGGGTGVWIFIQFGALALGSFVMIKVSGLHWTAALVGFFVCPAAVVLEILYELLKYGHS